MQVWARTEELHKMLRHPTAGGFGAPWPSSADWPDDSYTFRRMRDGDISKDGPVNAKASEKVVEKTSRKAAKFSDES